MDFKCFTFEVKEQKEEDGFFRFKAIASTGQIDSDRDIVQAGAFSESIKNRKVKMLLQHDSRQPIGRWVEIKQTEKGLEVSGELPLEDTLVKGRVVPQIKAGNLDSLSVGFMRKEWEYKDIDGEQIRIITKADLWEISIVTFPANEGAVIESFKRLSDNQFPEEFTEREYHSENAIEKMAEKGDKANIYLLGKSLPVCDYENETLKLSTRGLFSAIAKIDGGRLTESKSEQEQARNTAIDLLNRCGYKKSDKWSIGELKNLSISGFTDIIRSGKMNNEAVKLIAFKSYSEIRETETADSGNGIDLSRLEKALNL